jgi:hypothetical protein
VGDKQRLCALPSFQPLAFVHFVRERIFVEDNRIAGLSWPWTFDWILPQVVYGEQVL